MTTRYVIRTQAPRRRRLALDQLNDEQRAVVTSDGGYALVIAGAGSGKTRTLTHRAAYLIDRGLDPRRMLLCTFTNRAAREMLGRVEELLEVDLRRIWAGTFHHIANLALRRYGGLIGLTDRYTILDREDARELLAGCLADEGAALRERRYPRAAVLQNLLSMAINCQMTLAEALKALAPRFYDLADEIARIADRYATRKLKLGLVDFDDLLLMFKILLSEHPDAARELTARFEHVLVDEYQDTNQLQGDIVDLCATEHGNLMVVGDDAQSIYAFRGAHFKNIIGFSARHPQAQTFKLETNYRSTPEILELANRSIAVNIHQHPKRLRPVRASGARPRPAPPRGRLPAGRLRRPAGARAIAAGGPRAATDRGALPGPLPQPRAAGGAQSAQDPLHRPLGAALFRTSAHQGRGQLSAADPQPGRRPRLAAGAQALLGAGQAHRRPAAGCHRQQPAQRDRGAQGGRAAQPQRPGSGRASGRAARANDGGHHAPRPDRERLLELHYRGYAEASFANAATRIDDLLQLADFSRAATRRWRSSSASWHWSPASRPKRSARERPPTRSWC